MPWAQLSDVRCHYEIEGEGAPLLLIAGLGGTSRLWDPVVPDLGSFFSVIVFDNRGIGQSIARRTPRTLWDLSADIVELLDYLQLDRCHVLGVSLGGVIAQRLAIDHPSRIDRLVLVSCADAFSPYLRQMAMLLAHSLRRFPKEMFARTMELLATAPDFLDANADLVEQRIQDKCRSRVKARTVGNQLRCLACSEVEPRDYKITVPTLVISGEYDPIIPSCYARRMAQKIPGARFMMVPGAGHNPVVDYPEQVLPRIIPFLQGERGADGSMPGEAASGALMPGGAVEDDSVRDGSIHGVLHAGGDSLPA